MALYHHKEEYHKTTLTGVCFFTYDNKFDNQKGLYNSIYYNDKKRLKYFKEHFEGVKFFIEPDYSLTGDMDFAERVSRRKKMRLVSVWLATELKAVVIPLITYGDERSFEYMLDGIEESKVVAFSTKGSVKNSIQKELLLKAIKYTVDKLPLKYIVVYSVCNDEIIHKLFSYAIAKGIQIIIPRNRIKEFHER